MISLFIKIFGTFLAPAARSFHKALEEPQIAQQFVQAEIFNRLVASKYGQSLGIQSIADWNHVPVVNYDDIQQLILSKQEKECQDINLPKSSFLTPEPTLFYEKTSGSRGAAKLIPYTHSLRRSFNHMFCVWAHDLITHEPSFSTGKVYFCISPQLGDSQISAGLEDDSQYLDRWLRWFLSPFLVSPPGIHRAPTAEVFKERLSLALLREEQLEIISIWSPSFLKVLLDYIQAHQRQLCELLKTQISAERQALLLESTIPWTLLWQELKLISCWDSANAADSAQFLRSLFPNVMVQGKGLLATEAPMTLPLIAAGGCVPVLDEVFFEFEDRQGNIRLLHEIEIGETYEIILSQKGGLYRYRIGDRVRVSHFYKNTPCLEFIGRSEATSDLVGEKLHEEFVRDVLNSLALEGTFFKSLVPVRKPIDRYVLLLDQANEEPSVLAQRLDEALKSSPHYRHARLLGQLAPAQVLVSQQIPELAIAYKIQSGMKWGDLKHQLLVTTPLEELLPKKGTENRQ